MSKAFITGLFGSAGGGKPEEEKVVNLNMADGDQIVTPTEGTTMSRVTVTKPNSLVPENVKLNTVIGGITGSYAGQRTGGEFIVQVIDIDGTVLDYAELNAGDTFTLPTPPDRTADGLIFQKWVSVFGIVNNTVTVTDDNIVIGPVYRAASGYTEILVDIPSDNFAITLNLNKSNTGAMAVDWGDSFSSSTAANGAVSLEHAFFIAGKYTIKIMTADGYALGTGGTGNARYLLGSSTLNSNIVEVIVGNNVTALNTYCLYQTNMERVSLSDSIVTLGQNALAANRKLTNIIIPDSVRNIDSGAFNNCSELKSVVLSQNISSIGDGAFNGCSRLEYINLPNIEIITASCFRYCLSLRRVIIPESVLNIQDLAFANSSFEIFKCRGKSVSVIGASAFNSCSGNFLDLSGVTTTTIPASFLGNNTLRKLVLFRYTTSVSLGQITQPTSILTLLEIDITRNRTVPTLSNASYFPASTALQTKIYVRQSLLQSYKAATNWSAFANLYIGVPDDEIDD